MIRDKLMTNLIKIFILSLPVIDALAYFGQDSLVSVSLLLKGIFTFILLVYVVVTYREDKMKQFIIFFILAMTLLGIFLTFNVQGDFIPEFIGMSKLLFLPIFLVLLYCVKSKDSEWLDWDIIINVALTYAVIVIVTTMVGINATTFNSSVTKMYGSRGTYIAGNDVGAIMGIGISILLLGKINKFSVLKLLVLFIATAIMGVKTAPMMLVLTSIYILIRNFKQKRFVKQTITGMTLLCVFGAIYIPNSNIVKNLEVRSEYIYNSGKYDVDSVEETFYSPYIVINEYVLSGRLMLVGKINDVYINSSTSDYFEGIGFSPYLRSTEMDFIDTFYRLGILGFIFYLGLLIYSIKLHIKKYVFDEKMFVMFMIFLCGFLVGHVLSAISVAMVLAIIISTMDVKE